ncbi:MAG: ATP-binding protein [Planctomycetota bacterium]|nr:ATP-binding protein [Planctomycetota bacterium]
MSSVRDDPRELTERIRALEAENEQLRRGLFAPRSGKTVRVPDEVRGLFDVAEDTVRQYFDDITADPSQGTVEIAGERYVLVRAAALSWGFLNAIRALYANRGDAEALHIGKTMLFDIAHVIGISDARNFHRKMGVTDPIAKLSAGPVHFAYSGWAFVEILPESRATPDDDFYLIYNHPFSFESDSWLRAGHHTDFAVCVMNAGYSSGWCEASFGMPLTAVEIACKAKGDENCTFVMAPPHRMRAYVEEALTDHPEDVRRQVIGDIPTLFERKAIEERLREAVEHAEAASAAKSLFLANMSHEIRTPLTGLLGMAHLLLNRELGDEQREFVETIDRSGKALLGILNDILDLSKVEAGKMTIRTEPCSVRSVLQDIADVLQAPVAEKGLTFALDVEEAVPPFVHADPMRLRQVVLNLAGNAVKFTDKGNVAIRATWTPPETLRVEVKDTGIGIGTAELVRLFEPFAQGDTTQPGTGLGLSIVRRLVSLMDGEIHAESTPGEGSTFWFTLPVEPAESPAETDVQEELPPTCCNADVLLVEDDPISRLVITKLLTAEGCRVTTAINGEDAVVATTAGDYDIVFMDCRMPVMDGYEATRRIRQIEGEGRHTPVIAMTASVMSEEHEECRAAGMDDFLGKPLDLQRLRAVLRRWL